MSVLQAIENCGAPVSPDDIVVVEKNSGKKRIDRS
jgi:hypothetical protein